MSTWAVIMAGGSGTRFWPLSRRDRPKQLLPLAGGESLLRATVARLGELVPPERVLVVTSEALAAATAAELPEVPRANVLAEPLGRNTAPCVAWAAAHARRRDPEATLAVLPADHHIGDPAGFVAVLRRALALAEGGDLVTVGIAPTRPETGYGYIELAERLDAASPPAHRAARFVEKPSRERAEEYLASGRFVWNSGMFFFRAAAILEAIARHLPALAVVGAAPDDEAVRRAYPALPSISIDHGVMEQAERIAVVPASFGWSDLGSWTTAHELAAKDADGNVLPADGVAHDARGSYVHAPPGKLVALVGVSDLCVIDTGDALLVVPRERAQDVRAVVDALAARKDERR